MLSQSHSSMTDVVNGATDSLNVAVFSGADPDLGPRRRDRQPFDPAEGCLVRDLLSVRPVVIEVLASCPPRDPWARVGDVAKVRCLRQLRRGDRGVKLTYRDPTAKR